jgi:hypothetical protein
LEAYLQKIKNPGAFGAEPDIGVGDISEGGVGVTFRSMEL